MNKRTRAIAALLVMLSLCGLFSLGKPAAHAAAETNPTLKIGLYYGSSALSSANLDNHVGSGYQWGYFDDNRNFVVLGQTAETTITMMKDANLYLATDGAYYDTKPSSTSGVIGAYHLQSSASYATFAQANSAAAALKAYAAFPAYINGTYRVRVGAYESAAQANAAQSSIAAATGQSWQAVGASSSGVTVTKTKTATILFEYENGSRPLGVMPVSTGAKALTWFKNNQYYGGMEYSRSGGNLSVINVVSMQDYIKGVVPYEMSASWPLEALKAQACCARTYAYGNQSKHQSQGFDLCNTTDCQVYRGAGSATANSDLAVDSTLGQYVTYEGKIATTFYHSSNGGSTENSENVWGGYIAYCRAVADPYENLDEAYNGRWTSTATNELIETILKSKGVNISGVTDVYVDEFTQAGNVYRLCVVDGSGQVYSYEKEKARTILNSSAHGFAVNSLRYTINGNGAVTEPEGDISVYINGEKTTSSAYYAIGADGSKQQINLSASQAITGSGAVTAVDANGSTSAQTVQTAAAGMYTFSGTGWGHSVGMSQYGAKGMAERGFSYDEIIRFYFTGVEVSAGS